MTDATAPSAPKAALEAKAGSLLIKDKRTKARQSAEARFKAYGLGAIIIGLMALVVLLWAILSNGIPAFQRTVVEVPLTISQEEFDAVEATLF
ncbi:MAG: DUF3333 domain-containing protein, partial [Pseudomonadota bacterium]